MWKEQREDSSHRTVAVQLEQNRKGYLFCYLISLFISVLVLISVFLFSSFRLEALHFYIFLTHVSPIPWKKSASYCLWSLVKPWVAFYCVLSIHTIHYDYNIRRSNDLSHWAVPSCDLYLGILNSKKRVIWENHVLYIAHTATVVVSLLVVWVLL
jgi:hypothetical protein